MQSRPCSTRKGSKPHAALVCLIAGGLPPGAVELPGECCRVPSGLLSIPLTRFSLLTLFPQAPEVSAEPSSASNRWWHRRFRLFARARAAHIVTYELPARVSDDYNRAPALRCHVVPGLANDSNSADADHATRGFTPAAEIAATPRNIRRSEDILPSVLAKRL
jgi:hypothetical protein